MNIHEGKGACPIDFVLKSILYKIEPVLLLPMSKANIQWG